jgi:hypothetical protein
MNYQVDKNIANKIYKDKVKIYKANLDRYILTTRFSDETWNENVQYRKYKKFNGCVYSSPDPITNAIQFEKILFILEMNNDKNEIMGIGMIRNDPKLYKHKVYDNERYNRYQYVGNNRIDRSDMNGEEEDIMKVFDNLCFKGNRHMKRGQGLKMFPIEMIYNCLKILDLVEFINNMFKRRLKQK